MTKAPPLTWMTWAVIWRAPAEARNTAVSAMSAVVPGRLSWVAATRASRRAPVTAGAISQRISRAEQAGLVARSPAADGSRAVLVALTAAGHELIERTVDHVLSREAQLVQDLDSGQRAELAGHLDRLLACMAARATGSVG